MHVRSKKNLLTGNAWFSGLRVLPPLSPHCSKIHGAAQRVSLKGKLVPIPPHLNSDKGVPLSANIHIAQISIPSTINHNTHRGKKRRSISATSADRIRLFILLGAALLFPMMYVAPGLYGALCAVAGLAWLVCGLSLLAVLGAL